MDVFEYFWGSASYMRVKNPKTDQIRLHADAPALEDVGQKSRNPKKWTSDILAYIDSIEEISSRNINEYYSLQLEAFKLPG